MNDLKTQSYAAFLKESNAHLHRAVEDSMKARDIFSPEYQKSDYIALLKRLYLAHQLIEEKLKDFRSIGNSKSFLCEQRLLKTNWLQADLEALEEEIPLQNLKLNLKNKAEAIGAFYVMEGASLGGAVILKQIEKHQWAGPAKRYYSGYADKTGFMWKSFLTAFETFAETKKLPAEKVRKGAEKAYKTFLKTEMAVA